MSRSAFHPEDKARSLIDKRLVACGWLIQSKTEMNLGAGLGVAVREFQTTSGPVDYGLFVGRKLCGVIEAKPEGTTLSGYSEQAARYIADVPKHLVREEGQVRFEYVASGTETLFRDHGDPDPASRRVFTFHRPETLERQLKEPLTLRGRLQSMAAFVTDGLRTCQIDAVSALEDQGLFYLDWLMDHRKDLQWLVLEKLGKKDAEGVDWSAPRLICIAGDFNKYDDHAVKQMQRNIELIRYRRFGPELLMLDLVAATSVKGSPTTAGATSSGEGAGAAPGKYKTISTVVEELDAAMIDRLEALRAALMAFGDDVQETILRLYIAFKSPAWNSGQRRPRYFCSSKLTPSPFNLSPASPETSRILAISVQAIWRSRSPSRKTSNARCR
jgi:hypothetical protein